MKVFLWKAWCPVERMMFCGNDDVLQKVYCSAKVVLIVFCGKDGVLCK
jgi:hypothetical protein